MTTGLRTVAMTAVLAAALAVTASSASAQDGDGEAAVADLIQAWREAERVLDLDAGRPNPMDSLASWFGPHTVRDDDDPALTSGGLLDNQVCPALAEVVETVAEAKSTGGLSDKTEEAVETLRADRGLGADGCHELLAAHMVWDAALKFVAEEAGESSVDGGGGIVVNADAESPLEASFMEHEAWTQPWGPDGPRLFQEESTALAIWSVIGFAGEDWERDGVAVYLYAYDPSVGPHCGQQAFLEDYLGRVVLFADCPLPPSTDVCPSSLFVGAADAVDWVEPPPQRPQSEQAAEESPEPADAEDAPEPAEGEESFVPMCRAMLNTERAGAERDDLESRARELAADMLQEGEKMLGFSYKYRGAWQKAWWAPLDGGGFGCGLGREAGRDGMSACQFVQHEECHPTEDSAPAGALWVMTMCSEEVLLVKGWFAPDQEEPVVPVMRKTKDTIGYAPAVSDNGVRWGWAPPVPAAPSFGAWLSARIDPGFDTSIRAKRAAAAFGFAYDLGLLDEESLPGLTEAQWEAASRGRGRGPGGGNRCMVRLYAAFAVDNPDRSCEEPDLGVLTGWGWAEQLTSVGTENCADDVEPLELLPMGIDGRGGASVDTKQIVLQDRINRTFLVHRCLESVVAALFDLAEDHGVQLTVASAYRGWDKQVELRRENCGGEDYVFMAGVTCKPLTALPGNSMHNLGMAVDFNMAATGGYSSPIFSWVQSKAGPLVNEVPGEYWHWALKRTDFERG